MSHRIREAMRTGGLAPMGGAGGVVEIDETIYGRAATHPKGRGPFGAKLTNSAHKNVILSLVERGGEVRSYHVAGSTVSEVIPIVVANVAHEAQVMTDAAALYKRMNEDGWFGSHDRVDHSEKEYARYEEGRPTIHTNTVEGYFSLFKRGMRGVYQHCGEKHLHRYLAEFDFRYNNRKALGVEDAERAAKMVNGVKGKSDLSNSSSVPIRSRKRGGAAVLRRVPSSNCFRGCFWVNGEANVATARDSVQKG